MRCLLLLVLFWLSGFAALAQQQLVREISAKEKKQIALRDSIARKRAQEKSLSYQFTDPQTKRTYLLIADANGAWRYRATLNHEAAISTGASALQDEIKGFHLTGEGIVCGIWDDGFIRDHIELGSRIFSKEGTNPQNHATHVTGTILASGINSSAKGMAPESKAFTYYFDNDEAEMNLLSTTDENGLLFSNHSYGTVTGWSKPNGIWTWYGDPAISSEEDYLHGFYSERSKSLDALAFTAPYHTIVWATGNDRGEPGDGTHPADCNKGTGYDCIISDAVGKNIITVGAVNKVMSYTSPSSVVMSTFSSWGPTDDGRIKPDLVGVGVNVFSLSATGANTYTTFSGTSMATPSVTGSLMLLQQLYGKLKANKRMKAATVKALAIHTAREAGSKPGPDYQFGWGLINVEEAANFLVTENGVGSRLIESTLLQGAINKFEIQPIANKKITITLSWTDPEGNPVANALDPPDQMLINDLDIRLIDENGIITQPWILNPTVPQAQATQGDNTRDNVEKIEFETPLQKKYTVLVRHKGQLKFGKQDYSLAISYSAFNSASKVFYWIGNSGSWNDAQNWSLTQGGGSASEIPGNNDMVIFDTGSLTDNDVVDLSEDASCGKLIWLADKNVKVNMMGHILTITGQLIIASNKLSTVGNGILKFSAATSGVVNFLNNNFSSIDLEFEQGNWTMNGSCSTNKIVLEQGAHQWTHTSIHANEIKLVSPDSWDISQAQLTIDSNLIFPTNAFTFSSEAAAITVENPNTEVDWKTQDYNGSLYITGNGGLTMSGGNKIAKLISEGKLVAANSFIYDTLKLLSGSELVIANNQTQTILLEIEIESSAVKPTTISAQTKATLHIEAHQKLCFDHLIISNIDVTGQSVVNASLNSAVSNSTNWLQMTCEDVLFANFTVEYPCEGAMTNFMDASTAAPISWQWDFGDNLSSENISSLQNPEHVFSATGIFEVTLTIQKGTQSQSFVKSVEIVENTIPLNSVVLSNNQLISLNTATAYQWYVNRKPIEDASDRSFPFQDKEGVYEVVTIQDNCNRISEPYLVTSVNNVEQDIYIFPNPTDASFMIEYDKNDFCNEAILKNNLGQVIAIINIEKPISTLHLQEGLYFLQLKTGNGEVIVRKIIVAH